MDRREIERQDFPAARRGYDVAAVDSHLRRVADEFDTLGRSAAGRPHPASLAQDVSTQVRAILEAAEASAHQLREEAAREATGHVARVEHAAQELLGKLDGLQGELDLLLTGLRSTVETLTGSLGRLSRDVGSLGGPLASPAPPATGVAVAAGPDGMRSDDEAGARLVALNLALEGAQREEAARYLAEHYRLDDLEVLLDDVFTSAGR